MGDQGNTDSPRKYEVINETNSARYSLFWDLNQDVVFDYTASLGHYVGLFVPLHFRSRERKVHRWNFRSRGTFVPWKPPNQDKIVINEEDVYKQLCTLNENKSPGPDNS